MKIRTMEIAGLAPALNALRLPFNKECRSITKSSMYTTNNPFAITKAEYMEVDPQDITLMSTLVKRGNEHAKAVRGIIVYAEIDAPIYWWCEMETYRIGHERLSSASTMHVDCKGLSGDELVKAKSEIPMGKELKKIDYFSYQCLRNIYRQRKGHRLPEWKVFLDWIETLPLSKELITVGL